MVHIWPGVAQTSFPVAAGVWEEVGWKAYQNVDASQSFGPIVYEYHLFFFFHVYICGIPIPNNFNQLSSNVY